VKCRGQILAPNTRAGRISILRVFFRDLQEWELIPRRFDPMRSMITPKSLLALIGPNPRAIADDVWAKLLWTASTSLPMTSRKKAIFAVSHFR
jgi:hypothetical protein